MMLLKYFNLSYETNGDSKMKNDVFDILMFLTEECIPEGRQNFKLYSIVTSLQLSLPLSRKMSNSVRARRPSYF
jgi:hypothetical protein